MCSVERSRADIDVAFPLSNATSWARCAAPSQKVLRYTHPLILPKISHPRFHGLVFPKLLDHSFILRGHAHKEWVSGFFHHILEHREKSTARGDFKTKPGNEHVICRCIHSKRTPQEPCWVLCASSSTHQKNIVMGNQSKSNSKTTCPSGMDNFMTKIRWSWNKLA